MSLTHRVQATPALRLRSRSGATGPARLTRIVRRKRDNQMRIPWKELKDAEIETLRWRRAGEIPPKIISRLGKLVNRCRKDPEAEAVICYHGSLALLYEFDHDWPCATRHRMTEISF